mmetsp:Transcript_29250/g.80100  ORF Transcript_29250/g.80100 Transcript_29250/m.80100 type:complete len:229 (-) Transcript_29250:7-693(-)
MGRRVAVLLHDPLVERVHATRHDCRARCVGEPRRGAVQCGQRLRLRRQRGCQAVRALRCGRVRAQRQALNHRPLALAEPLLGRPCVRPTRAERRRRLVDRELERLTALLPGGRKGRIEADLQAGAPVDVHLLRSAQRAQPSGAFRLAVLHADHEAVVRAECDGDETDGVQAHRPCRRVGQVSVRALHLREDYQLTVISGAPAVISGASAFGYLGRTVLCARRHPARCS